MAYSSGLFGAVSEQYGSNSIGLSNLLKLKVND